MHRFNWGIEEYSLFKTLYQIVTCAAVMFVLPALSWSGCSDNLILLLSSLSQIAGKIMFGVAENSTIFFAGKLIVV